MIASVQDAVLKVQMLLSTVLKVIKLQSQLTGDNLLNNVHAEYVIKHLLSSSIHIGPTCTVTIMLGISTKTNLYNSELLETRDKQLCVN